MKERKEGKKDFLKEPAPGLVDFRSEFDYFLLSTPLG
jgi:hypothetical protein